MRCRLTRCRLQILVSGIVQGVGFRPLVWKLAHIHGLDGSVRNVSQGLLIEVQGDSNSLHSFVTSLRTNPPPLAVIKAIDVSELAVAASSGFIILNSAVSMTSNFSVGPDTAPCAECLQELFDPQNRRFNYPFINCTNCGPRFSITCELPYDRRGTTMRKFGMCNACQTEYEDPLDRRFHAEPIACWECGPRIWFVEGAEVPEENFHSPPDPKSVEQHALSKLSNAICSGKIVAVKGVGGFHLICDATNDSAVQTLRQRKGREDKPFAVMVRDIAQCEKLAEVSPLASELLHRRERPIALLPKSSKCDSILSQYVAPRNPLIGLLLPYSPLHYVITTTTPPLVVTSGNISDEPLVTDNAEASQRLAPLADVFLLHDRPIQNACDDSVVRFEGKSEYPLRRSRGYTPTPIVLKGCSGSVLAAGGDNKATICITQGDTAYVSQHIGNLNSAEALKSIAANAEFFTKSLRIEPQVIAADMHPDYVSVRWAKQQADSLGVELFRVQHHHAHLAALAAEHEWNPDKPLIGFVFDGTGYGADGAIWGGEMLCNQRSQFKRLAHLRYSPLPGGDASVRQPYRVALAQLFHANLGWDNRLPSVQACANNERQILKQQLQRNFNCAQTSSMGRLFDAVGSLLGLRHSVTFEAQGAMELEALASQGLMKSPDCLFDSRYQFALHDGETTIQFDATPVLTAIWEDLLTGVDHLQIAACFHQAIANIVVKLSLQLAPKYDADTIGLSGGVFQNALLTTMVQTKLEAVGMHVLTHRIVPANDGGLSLGQAWLASLR
jgi:hydrogenase maturation protein HypF